MWGRTETRTEMINFPSLMKLMKQAPLSELGQATDFGHRLGTLVTKMKPTSKSTLLWMLLMKREYSKPESLDFHMTHKLESAIAAYVDVAEKLEKP